MNYPIRIRIGTEYGQDASFAEAVQALQGKHDGYHQECSVSVVATYGEDVTVPARPGRREVTYKQGEPVFGHETKVYGRGNRFGLPKDAQVSWGSMGSLDTYTAQRMVQIHQLALQLAIAANAEPPCPECASEEK